MILPKSVLAGRAVGWSSRLAGAAVLEKYNGGRKIRTFVVPAFLNTSHVALQPGDFGQGNPTGGFYWIDADALL